MHKRKILIISSKGADHSAGLGRDIWNALEKAGYEIDFLTKYKENFSSPKYIGLMPLPLYSQVKKWLNSLGLQRFLSKLKKNLLSYVWKPKSPYAETDGIALIYPDERHPDVSSDVILSKINKDYDAVLTIFWQDMINSSSLRDIHAKLKCPIFILSPDMAPLTGGCYYSMHCKNYTRQCQDCPVVAKAGILSDTHGNYLLKKNNYLESDCYFLGNSWMRKFAYASGAFPESRVIHAELVIDEDRFVPNDKILNRRQYNLDSDDFVILIRSCFASRKGNNYIADAIERMLNRMRPENRKKVKILAIGDDFFAKNFSVSCDLINLGHISAGKLIELYQISNVFVNGSYDDAGPSMINQSIMCGTPVVCFRTGCALDVVIDGKSGYSVEIGDSEAMSDAIYRISQLSHDDYDSLSKSSREVALEHNSASAFVKVIDNLLTSITHGRPVAKGLNDGASA